VDNTKLEIEKLRCRLENRVVGRRIIYHQVLASSMDEVHKLAMEDGSEGTVVVASEETAARGRFGRTWISSPGKNLSFSVLLRPKAAQMNYLNMATTLAVWESIKAFPGLMPTIKWPNDILVRGRKISGILIESDIAAEELRYAVVGVGINVNFDPSQHQEIACTATSLYLETGLLFNRTELLGAVLEKIDDHYESVKRGESLTRRWADQLETIGHNVRVKWKGKTLEGKARGVDEQGNLVLVRVDGTTVTVLAGEVTMQLGLNLEDSYCGKI